MSFSDEATPEEVAPEPGQDTGETWSEADSAAVEAEAVAAGQNGYEPEESGADEAPGVLTGKLTGDLAAPSDPMAVLAAERDEYLQALQRNQADFENYRKRIARQQQEQSARASADLVSKLLPILDTLDLAQAHMEETGIESEDAKALLASRSMLLDVLAKEGLERVDQAGVPFDPAVHDAVAREEGEGADVVIDQVLRSGYRWKGQVLRPAMVRVRG